MTLQRINREEFLHCLESVHPGIASRPNVEQSDCFCFKDGEVATFNEEVACRANTVLDKELTGAVKAEKLLDILRKSGEEEIDVGINGAELVIKAANSELATFTLESEISLPVDYIEKPDKWQPIAEGFAEAVHIVQTCSGNPKLPRVWQCIHIHPKWIEACNREQLCRWKMPAGTGVEEPVLVRASAVKNIVQLGAEKFAVTPSWMHFQRGKGKSRVLLSCRTYHDPYTDMTAMLKVSGVATKLPDGMEKPIEKASVFSSENTDANYIKVVLKKGKLILLGKGSSGSYRKSLQAEWDGAAFKFLISPMLLQEIIKRKTEVEISLDPPRMIIKSGKWKYISCLGRPDEEEKRDE
jgi:hypothetical protein